MNGSDRASIFERLRRMLDIPADTITGISHIEIFGFRELEIDGCTALEKYSDEQIVLLLRDGSLTIEGSRLELSSFSGGLMRINGSILCVSFRSLAKNGGCDA